MRKLWMVGVLAAALFAQTARAEDAAKERREAAAATGDQMKQEGREMKAGAQQAGDDAQREMREQQAKTKEEMSETQHDARQASTQGEKKHPLFEGKDNFDVEGKIQKVSAKSITVAREGLPAAGSTRVAAAASRVFSKKTMIERPKRTPGAFDRR